MVGLTIDVRTILTPTNGFRPKHLSYSSIDRFDRCPKSWWNGYIAKKWDAPSRPMVIGSLFGRCIEMLHSGRPFLAAPLMAKMRKDERAAFEPGDAELVDRMTLLYSTADGCPRIGTPEYKFSVFLPDFKEVPIIGYFDLLGDDGRIAEFKTSRWADHPKWGWTQRRIDNHLQLAIYWYAYLIERDETPKSVDLIAIGYRDDRLSLTDRPGKPNMAQVLDVQDKAIKLWRALEDEGFPDLCGKCE